MSMSPQEFGINQATFTKLYSTVEYEISILAAFSFSLVVWKTFSRLVKKPKLIAGEAARLPEARPIMTPKALQRTVMEIISLSQEQYTRSLRMYRELVRQGEDRNIHEEQFYFLLVQASIRVGHFDVVCEILQRVKKRKMNLSVQFFHSVLKLLASKQQFKECLQVQRIFGDTLPVERTICSCLTLAAAETNQLATGMQAVARLRSIGEQITGKDYQNLFRGFAKAGNHFPAMQLFQGLIKSHVPFDAVITNMVLATCVAARDMESADAILEQAKASSGAIPLDVVSYNTMVKGYARQHKLEKCFDLIASMHASGIASDEVTYSTILDACISEHCFDKANDVIDSFIASGCAMNTVLYTTFMKGFVRMEMLDKAMALYKQMRQGNVISPEANGVDHPKPDVILYSVLIKANCDQRLLEPALHLTKDMIEDGLEPDDIIINRLLDGCRHISDGDTAARIFTEFVESGKVKPTLPTLATMVKTYGKCNRVNEAMHLVKSSYDKFGLHPSVVLYTCLMSACIRNRRLDLACEAFDAMIKMQAEPDATTYSTLFKGCAAERDLAKAVHIARTAAANKSQSHLFPAEDIQNLISSMSGVGGMDVIHLEALRAILRNRDQRWAAVESAPWRK
eukprot:gnl/MRDRNA2_/MRDRNA2_137037_c0_seq1.p1 gnl/MRDRNA2_/MRDRNA2_137037_c0~~gnl/MRDRNA2_/MRDRNA2_137037_c0_seq1.p1  ORF type:complete len:626 (+),score=112.07 gnl/MRDRNA2_/MRDRNA2_137037_c0_seq1:105-1982(+)